MSKLLKSLALGASVLSAVVFVAATSAAASGDADKGAKVFKKCAACHAVGDGAKNKVGPQLNDVFGRSAGGLDGYKYSKAMVKAGAEGLNWDQGTLTTYLTKPKAMIKGTKMAFAGLRKPADIENLLAYLAQYSAESTSKDEATAPAAKPQESAKATANTTPAPAPASSAWPTRAGGVFGLGRVATEDEVAAWDIDIRPDGKGLPEGSGTVAAGEELYTDNCAVCHGDFGEGVGRWPVLAGGQGTLQEDRPEKTIGSYWPYLSTVYDYVRRAMPFGDARSLSNDDVYALTAYLLYLNDLVDDEDFELSNKNFQDIRLPNEENFIPDGRPEEAHNDNKGDPCMENCTDRPVEITMRARIVDVTPGAGETENSVGTVD
ncbi:c-type cytochrome [Roseibium algae]|uniref:C-type cytochrome n=1 Tax=Roseibium algae TaxID=3123038 RepID=A0ABU8TK84_9HYPH